MQDISAEIFKVSSRSEALMSWICEGVDKIKSWISLIRDAAGHAEGYTSQSTFLSETHCQPPGCDGTGEIMMRTWLGNGIFLKL